MVELYLVREIMLNVYQSRQWMNYIVSHTSVVGLMLERRKNRCVSRRGAYLYAEVASVHVVAEEQIASGAGGTAHLEELHQVEELAVNIAAHLNKDRGSVSVNVSAESVRPSVRPSNAPYL